jgi:hypothetical protein
MVIDLFVSYKEKQWHDEWEQGQIQNKSKQSNGLMKSTLMIAVWQIIREKKYAAVNWDNKYKATQVIR